MRTCSYGRRIARLPPSPRSLLAAPALAADALLSGTITSSTGEKMGGVTVSAKPDGGTITTTVFTDEAGDYYFPPLPTGQYRVWAQALSFQTAKGEVDLAANAQAGFRARADERSGGDVQAASRRLGARCAAGARRRTTSA